MREEVADRSPGGAIGRAEGNWMTDGTGRQFATGVVLAVATIGLLVGVTAVTADDSLGGSSPGELTRGEPDIDAFVPEPELVPGSEETVEIEVQNAGDLRLGTERDRVTTARGVSVEVVDEGPFEVKSGTSGLGSLQEGELQPVSQQVGVPDDLEPGEYEITIDVGYEYTRQVSSGGTSQERSGTETIDLTLIVPDEPRFEISDVETAVEPGGDGEATLEIENVGVDDATDARATITGGGGVTVDGEAAEEFLGDLESGEHADVIVDVAIAETASDGEKPLAVEFEYGDGSGVEQEPRTETASLAPAPSQSFSLSNLEDTLSVGYDGTVRGELTNDGPRTVDDAVVVVEPTTDSLFVEDTRYALPEIEPGETTSFVYPTDVSGSADAGPRQLEFTVEYGGGDRSTLSDGPFTERVEIDDRTDEFALDDDGITVEQGSSSEFTLEITNERTETLSNIDARLYADGDLETDNDEAFVPELEAGESAELSFDIWASGDASPETHPVELDFEYDTERGEEVLSDVYQHPVEVVPGEDGDGGILGSIAPLLALITAVGVGAAAWWQRR